MDRDRHVESRKAQACPGKQGSLHCPWVARHWHTWRVLGPVPCAHTSEIGDSGPDHQKMPDDLTASSNTLGTCPNHIAN